MSAPDAIESALISSVRRQFMTAINGRANIFKTDGRDLWSTFLSLLPEDLRQQYTCNACCRFVESYGHLVTITDEGIAIPLMWFEAPHPFAEAVAKLRQTVASANVTGPFLTPDAQWGTYSNHDSVRGRDWFHMSVSVPVSYIYPRQSIKTPGQAMAEKRQDYISLNRGLAEFTTSVVTDPSQVLHHAHTLLKSGQLYRPDKALAMVNWLIALHDKRVAARSARLRDNLTWLAVASAPAGFCHVKSGMLGTLLEDIRDGLPVPDIARRWQDKMAPDQYQRAQVAPTAGNIRQAEKIIADLDAAGSLARRYARVEEIPEFLWHPTKPAPVSTSGGVFAHITPKSTRPAPASVALPEQTMTWEKFQRTVLPDAVEIEAQIPKSTDRFVALVTAVNPDSPQILQWDNPFSWYYASGIDAEIRRRVTSAGGTVEGCDIRFSLAWNNRNDLDLHVVTPIGEDIHYANKRGRCGGYLDVDMNVYGETTTPVENTRWLRGTATHGRYRAFVRNFRFHELSRAATPFRVELEVHGQIFHFEGATPFNLTGSSSDIIVASFTYDGQRLASPPDSARTTSTGSASGWNVTAGQYAKVSGITYSPNLWGSSPVAHCGRHAIFLLDGCRDTSPARGRGFFAETLRQDLRPVRATLEAYTAATPIADPEHATACGIGMSTESPWNLRLRVRTANAVSTYLIDRWD